MARETNFVDLYRLLNVQPGCDMAEFKTAYRRSVAALHPDRRGDSQEDLLASEHLQQLTTLYSAAMDFKRRHGRLPGALFTPVPGVKTAEPPRGETAAIAPKRSSRWLVVAIALILGVAWLVWKPDGSSDASEQGSATDVAPSPGLQADISQRAPSSQESITIGMAAEAVRNIEGEPMVMGDSRWEYGPSWIRFENGTVVDWYSSPMHPLKTSSSRP